MGYSHSAAQHILLFLCSFTIGGPIPCVVSYRNQCAHKHTIRCFTGLNHGGYQAFLSARKWNCLARTCIVNMQNATCDTNFKASDSSGPSFGSHFVTKRYFNTSVVPWEFVGVFYTLYSIYSVYALYSLIRHLNKVGFL